MRNYLRLFTTLATMTPLSLLLCANVVALDTTEDDYRHKLLGKQVFWDKISEPQRMACVTCHDPATGGTGSVSGVNLHQVAITGANPHTAGSLKPPTNAYASFMPVFQECNQGGIGVIDESGVRTRYCGGNFWNGRAEGRSDGPLLGGATKHIGDEVFQGSLSTDDNGYILEYAKYFGATADQALNPMPNIAEQNIERQAVCEHVAASKYAPLYEVVWGEPIDCSDNAVAISAPDADVFPELEFDISFKRLMLAVCAWQHSSELNSFSSRRDAALRAELACLAGAADADPAVCGHENYVDSPGTFPLAGFTDQENLGHDLFYNTAFPRGEPPFPELPVTNCSFCHTSDTDHSDGTGLLELYADAAYHNIGTPVNPELPAAPDAGTSGHAQKEDQKGGFRTPTLRNVDKRKGNGFTKAYTHNGWFKSLESIVHFYNTSAIGGDTAISFGVTRCDGLVTEKSALADNCWPEAEWPDTVSSTRLVGNIGMSLEQEAAVVAYLKTLTDTVTLTAPAPYKAPKRAGERR